MATALITGASSGIGLELAKLFAPMAITSCSWQDGRIAWRKSRRRLASRRLGGYTSSPKTSRVPKR